MLSVLQLYSIFSLYIVYHLSQYTSLAKRQCDKSYQCLQGFSFIHATANLCSNSINQNTLSIISMTDTVLYQTYYVNRCILLSVNVSTSHREMMVRDHYCIFYPDCCCAGNNACLIFLYSPVAFVTERWALLIQHRLSYIGRLPNLKNT